MGKGPEVLDEIDRLMGVKEDVFSADPYVSAYNAGQRACPIKIRKIVEADETKFKEAEDAENEKGRKEK
jgi:hypothetical protein